MLGWSLLATSLALLLGALVGMGAHPVAHGFAAAVLAVGAVFGAAAVFDTTRVVFATRGREHHRLTLWTIIDVYAGHVVGAIAASLALWNVDAAAGRSVFDAVPAGASSWSALGNLALYTIYMLCGGGVVHIAPTAVEARVLLAVQLLLNTWAVIAVFAAAVATLAQHTDEPAKIGARRRWSP